VKNGAVTASLAGDFANHPNKSELAELLLIAMENIVAGKQPLKLRAGDVVVEVVRNGAPVTCDVAEVVTPPYGAEYDKPVAYRQMNLGGRPVAILNLRYLKKQPKRTSHTCMISNLAPPALNAPLDPALQTAFDEEIVAKQRKFFKEVIHGRAASPAGAYELQIRVLGYGFMDGEGDVTFISFRVVDHANDATVTYGRGFRTIGTKQEKDVREFASMVACL
jgi:hypothetical protein